MILLSQMELSDIFSQLPVRERGKRHCLSGLFSIKSEGYDNPQTSHTYKRRRSLKTVYLNNAFVLTNA